VLQNEFPALFLHVAMHQFHVIQLPNGENAVLSKYNRIDDKFYAKGQLITYDPVSMVFIIYTVVNYKSVSQATPFELENHPEFRYFIFRSDSVHPLSRLFKSISMTDMRLVHLLSLQTRAFT
jgi:hypothetical protein